MAEVVTEENYEKLVAKLLAKEAKLEDLKTQYETMVEKIRILSNKKNSLLDILTNDLDLLILSKEDELKKLTQLSQSIDVKDLIAVVKGDLKLSDVKVNLALLYLLSLNGIN